MDVDVSREVRKVLGRDAAPPWANAGVKAGAVSPAQLDAALSLQRERGGQLETCLFALGSVRRGELLQLLAREHRIPPAPPSRVLRPNLGLAGSADAQLLVDLKAIPFGREGETLLVAFGDPTLVGRAKEVPGAVRAFLALEADVDAGLSVLFPGMRSPLLADPVLLTNVTRRPDTGEPPEFRVKLAPHPGDDEPPPPEPSLADEVAEAASSVQVTLNDRAPEPSLAIEEPPGAAEEEYDPGPPDAYESQVQADVDFSRATGFDREPTAVMALADLARREGRPTTGVFELGVTPPILEGKTFHPPPGAPTAARAALKLYDAVNEGDLAIKALDFFGAWFSRILLLEARRHELAGLLGRRVDGSVADVAALRLPGEFAPPAGQVRYGAPPTDETLDPLHRVLGSTPQVALWLRVPVRVGEEWVVYADHFDVDASYEKTDDFVRYATELARALMMMRSRGGPAVP
jgi:hypothetical protein